MTNDVAMDSLSRPVTEVEIAAADVRELVEALRGIRDDERLHLDWSDDEWLEDSLRFAAAVLAKHE